MTDERDDIDQPVDSETGFEVAMAILGDLVGLAASRIRSERERAEPDSAVIAEWERRRDAWVLRRRELHPRDGLAIRAVLDDESAVLRSLRAQ